MEDIVIRDGLIVDGTGGQPYKGTIVINNGRITKITSQDNSYQGNLEIIATNKIITPGFIDVTNHSDTYLTLFQAPSQKSLVTQGVTTIIGGNCGASLAPLISNFAIKSIQKWSKISDININWNTLKEYLQVLESKLIAPNFATLIGYDTIRRGLIGDEMRPLLPQELSALVNIVDKTLREGALGLSVGLAFSHMQAVDKFELLKLASIVKKHNKILTIHTRNDNAEVVGSIQEVIDIVRQTKVKTHINHIKILGNRNWKYANEVNELLNQAILEKLPLTFDIFPYTANNMVGYLLLPSWVAQGGRDMLLQNLQDQAIRDKIILEMQSSSYDYSRIIISDSPMNRAILGKSIVEIAKNQGLSVEAALIQVILASEGRARFMVEAISDSHIQQLVNFNNCMIGSDSAGYDDNLIRYKGYDHPRSFGAFTKFLQDYVLTGRLSWQEAVPRITSIPARVFGLKDRGLLQERMQADIVIIDPNHLASCATFQQPVQYSQGIEAVIVNGKTTVQNGAVIALNGQIIRN